MMRRGRRGPKTIFSPHNVDTVKKFCKLGVRVEKLLDKEIERIAKENPEDKGAKAAQLELIRRHRETGSTIEAVRLELASIMQNIGVDVHK